MIEIDGGYLEGGGQILRQAAALAAITRKSCRIFNIRQGREKPGLAQQHILSIQALAQLSNGNLEGDYLGSDEIKFYPGQSNRDKIYISIPTAGSITLVLQSLMPAAIFCKNPVIISIDGGATDTFFSPTTDYYQYVFLKILEKMNVKVEVNILKRGFWPEGGAKVEVKVFPSTLAKLNLLERGQLKKIIAVSAAANSLKLQKVAERQISGVKDILGKLRLPFEQKVDYYDTSCPGSYIFLAAEFEKTIMGRDNLGRLGEPSEKVGRDCALSLLQEERSQGCLDLFMTDQILIYLALAGRKSQIKIGELTSHAETGIWVIEQFIAGKFKKEENLISWVPSK